MQIEYQGHTIEARLSSSDIDFIITGPLFPEGSHDRHHPSVAAAKQAIDNALKAQHQANKVKLSLEVYNMDGEPGTVIGIHGGNGTLTGQNLGQARGYSHKVYPRVRWIAEAIMKLNIARKEVNRLDGLLRDVGIDCKRISYGRPSTVQLERALVQLQKEFKETSEKAKAMPSKETA